MAKAKGLSKANKQIISNTVERWVATISDGKPNIEEAKRQLTAAYVSGVGAFRRGMAKTVKDITFYEVDSIAAFMIALGVVRGRMPKRVAVDLCQQINISADFLKPLRRDTLCQWNEQITRWWRRQPTEFGRTWLRVIREEFAAKEKIIATLPDVHRRWWQSRETANDRLMHGINSLNYFSAHLDAWLVDAMGNVIETRVIPSQSGWRERTINERVTEKRRREIEHYLLPGNTSTRSIIGNLADAVNVRDLMSPPDVLGTDNSVFIGEIPLALDAEILCKLLNITDPSVTWEHEVYHHLTAFATFQKSCILLAKRPTIHVNEEGNLHNSAGPAVEWTDGAKVYFNDGHFLSEGGRDIVEHPDRLTTAKILLIRNQETRRIAIERFGWDRFLVEANCPILDRRQNDVDNTIEMLVGPPEADAANGITTQYMMLFCRSTGRRYFLAVPRDIANCEQAQNWMANSGNISSHLLPHANKRIRLVGAS
jgi:hypothetical protein